MDRLKEIEARMSEIKTSVEKLDDEEEIKKLTDEVESLKEERKELKARVAREAITRKLEEGEVEAEEIKKEENKMEEKKFDLSSKEYRNAWAKKLMGLKEEKFTEDEKRALGDAVTTTATDFVASAADTQGINNGGLFIPTTVRDELLEIIAKQSPIFNDIRKLKVAGNVDLPYLYDADDGEWYAELTDTKNEGQEYRNLQLTGWELAKDIVITWKLEEMAVDSFIEFILEELSEKMGKALIKAVIYGNGSNKPTGVTNGLTPITTSENDTVIDKIIKTYKNLSKDARIGAKVYVSTDVNIDVISYKDKNGNYPYLSGIPAVKGFSVEVDPYLDGNDMVGGNMKYYILNEVASPRVDKESTIKGRKVTYGAYGIYDGKPRPDYFTVCKSLPSA